MSAGNAADGAEREEFKVVRESMLDGLSQLADYFGFSKVMGQLYGVLLLHGEPLSLDELMEALDISKASVSTNIRTLEHVGMVRQVWTKGKGDRRKYYEAEADLLRIITNIISAREMRDVERAVTVMQDNIDLLKKTAGEMSEHDRQTADLYIERISQMQAMFRFAQLVITSILGTVSELDVKNISRVNLD
jgi:DNA-binding transcriptional regulator GbsR (MarR family)